MSLGNERGFVSVFLDDPRMWVGTVVAGCGVWLALKVSPTEMTALNYAGGALALAGVLLGALLILLAVNRAAVCARLSREGTEGRGRVTAIKQSVWSRSSYVLRYRFRDNFGSEVAGRQFLLQDEALRWHEGEEGEVRFDAANSAQSVWLGRSLELEVATRAAAMGYAAQAVAPSPAIHPAAPAAPAALPSRRVLFSRSRSTRWAWIIFCAFLFAALCLAIGIVKVVEGQADADVAFAIYALTVAVLLAASVYKFAAGRREVAEQLRALRDGIPAHAVVTTVEEKRLRGRGGIITWSIGWIVSYEYIDRAGVTHSADSGFLSTREAARWCVGSRCPVIIDPDNATNSVWVG